MQFSVIVAFKNRNRQRVNHFLDSLQWQQQTNFELIFVNQGSDIQVNEWLEPLISNYTFARYIYNHAQGLLWNKSNALNIGIKDANGEYIVIADIDLVFPPDFFEKITSHLNPGIFTTYNAYYLPQAFAITQLKSLFLPGFLYAENENFIGLCIASRATFLRIKGYDEFYLVWGAEDIDIISRLELAGEKRVHISSKKTKLYHQWHPSNAPAKPDAWYLTMITHLFKGDRAKNDCYNWGKMCRPEDRPIFELIHDNRNEKQLTKIEFWEGQRLIFFNTFIKKFYLMPAGEPSYAEYKVDEKEGAIQKKGLKLFGKRQVEAGGINKKDVVDFFHYFIGTNRSLFLDYYLKVENDRVILYFIKNKG